MFWLFASIALRVLAFGWSVLLLVRVRDRRLIFLPLLLGATAARTVWISAERGFEPLSPLNEAMGTLISLLILLAVYFLERVYQDRLQARHYADEREADLRHLQEQYALVAESSQDIIWSMGIDGTVRFMSPAVKRILGYSPRELRGRPQTEVLAPSSLRLAGELTQRALAEGIGEYRFEAEHIAKDGESVWCEVSAVMTRNAEGRVTGLLGVTRDIRERKEAERQREELQSELLQAQKMEAVGQLAGGIAHDFNNHLTVILGYADQVRDELRPGHPARAMVDDMREAGERSAELTRKLLAFSRRQVVQPRVLDLNELVEGLEPMLRRLIGDHVQLRLDLDPELGLVLADRAQLEQVVMNLAVNARDAMPMGGAVEITTRRGSRDSADGPESKPVGDVRLTLRDGGVGMDEATQRRAFEPFFTTKPEGQGTGLGLSTVYGIVTQLGGEISVRSAPQRGTSFEVRLPQVEGEVEVRAPRVRAEPFGGSEWVLVVDDSELVRRFVRNALESRGYRTLEATDGEEALRLIEEGATPDLLVCDLVMPRLGGVELARRLARRPSPPQVLLMSGYTDDGVEGGVDPALAAGLLQKPFGAQELLAAVREILDRPRRGT